MSSKSLSILFGILVLVSASDIDKSAEAAQLCSAEQGQAYIDAGSYKQAVREFTCLIDAEPAAWEGYRGRVEARLMLREYADAYADFSKITAFVEPTDPNVERSISQSYKARLAVVPGSIPALTGFSFFRWAFFDYAQSIQLLKHLLEAAPQDPYGNLFLGSNRLLHHSNTEKGIANLEDALVLDPENPHARFITADAYTYGLPDPQRSFAEASLALEWGLDTPRIHAILAASYTAFGEVSAAAEQIKIHIEQVTTDLVPTAPLNSGESLTLSLAPGLTYEIPIEVKAGQAVSITTSSKDFYDSIIVLLDEDGTPVIGSDDANFYHAAFEWIGQAGGAYRLWVTSFEGLNTGELLVDRN